MFLIHKDTTQCREQLFFPDNDIDKGGLIFSCTVDIPVDRMTGMTGRLRMFSTVTLHA